MVKNIFLFVNLLFASNCYCALVERDWLSVGDGLITYDTETGIEWLDVPVTISKSYNEVTVLINQNIDYVLYQENQTVYHHHQNHPPFPKEAED